MLPSLHLLDVGGGNAQPCPNNTKDRALLSQVAALVPSSMSFDTLITFDAVYVFIGENHYIGNGSDKETLASHLTQLATNDQIKLYTEESGSDVVRNASDRLARLAGLPVLETVSPTSDRSMIALLEGLPSEVATYFSSRPEEIESKFSFVEPRALMELMVIARNCLDVRPARAVASFSVAASIAEDVLGCSLVVAEHLENDGSIDKRVLPAVTEYLKERMISLRTQIEGQIRWTVLQSLRDAVVPTDSPFMQELEASVFAPHVVSDAVFATKLIRMGPQSRPVVIVSGMAHSKTLKRMLSVLNVT